MTLAYTRTHLRPNSLHKQCRVMALSVSSLWLNWAKRQPNCQHLIWHAPVAPDNCCPHSHSPSPSVRVYMCRWVSMWERVSLGVKRKWKMKSKHLKRHIRWHRMLPVTARVPLLATLFAAAIGLALDPCYLCATCMCLCMFVSVYANNHQPTSNTYTRTHVHTHTSPHVKMCAQWNLFNYFC